MHTPQNNKSLRLRSMTVYSSEFTHPVKSDEVLMELPPNPGGNKGFVREGADVLDPRGKRKSTLLESMQDERVRQHARRSHTPESVRLTYQPASRIRPMVVTSNVVPGSNDAERDAWEREYSRSFGTWPGSDLIRNDRGPGPYMRPLARYMKGNIVNAPHPGNDPSSSCVIL